MFYIYLVLFLLYVPIFCVIVFSFNETKSPFVWSGFSLDWYYKMLHNRSLMESLWVSVQVAFWSALISAVIGTLAAVSVQHLKKWLAAFISIISYIPIIIPEIVLGVALLMFFSVLPVKYGILTLVLSHATFCIPYILIMVQVRMRHINPAVIEAAKDLGATKFQVFRTITLPLIAPAVFSGGLLAIAMSLDDVVISVFMSGANSTTLPVKIFSMLKIGVTPEINALCTVLLLFTFIVVGFMQFLGLNNFFGEEN